MSISVISIESPYEYYLVIYQSGLRAVIQETSRSLIIDLNHLNFHRMFVTFDDNSGTNVNILMT